MSARFVIGKLAGSLATLAFVVVFNFILFRVVNDDPVTSMFRGRDLTQDQLDTLRDQFNLNGSRWSQFWAYVGELLQGNLGLSIRSRRPVSAVIGDAILPTVFLVGTATLLAMIGILVGYRAGWRRRSTYDVGATSLSMVTYSMPDFWLGMVALGALAGGGVGLFPTGGITDSGSTATGFEKLLDQAHHMALPAMVMAVAYIGEYVFVARSAMIDTLREDYLQLARAKGLRDDDVRRKHAQPNAMLPVVSLSALNFGFVLSGAIAIESIFSWPGLGQLTFTALRGPDFPVLQGLFLLFSAALIVANLITDLTYGFFDPRVGGRR